MTRAPAQIAAATITAVAIAVAVVLLLLPSSSGSPAPRVMESLFQDDDHLVYASTPTVSRTLDTLASLGVDRVRVTILWGAIAPASTSASLPGRFSGSDPAAYAASAWAPYDRLVELAGARGIGVDFNLTAPGPLWAMAQPAPVARVANHYRPSAADFGAFVTAVGRRYSGSYQPPGASSPLPRVNYWSIWNEPNQPGWIAPQWGAAGGQRVMVAPALYRAYVDSAFQALRNTGHGPSSDTILIGELAPEGRDSTSDEDPIPPLPFLEALYCVDASFKPLAGQAAAVLACPASSGDFVRLHPGLFAATGFAHHPYSFFLPPTASMPDPGFVPLSDLPRLERALDAIFSAYGVKRQLPLYLTEYGYETNPPNPYRGVSPRLQSLYLNEAQYLAWADPRVRALAQFLLYDSPPDTRFPRGSIGYWSTFQTGLLYADGARKPSLNSYRLPIVVPQPIFAGGSPVFIWGMLRLARNDKRQQVQLQWRPLSGTYHTIATVPVDGPSGFVSVRLRLPGSGAVRILWTSPAGQAFHSRAVGVLQR